MWRDGLAAISDPQIVVAQILQCKRASFRYIYRWPNNVPERYASALAAILVRAVDMVACWGEGRS